MASDQQLDNLDEKSGKAPDRRVKDAATARNIYQDYLQKDSNSSYNRAAITSMFDGDPPYDESELVASGQGYRCNINFDEAGDLLEKSMASYVDMLKSVERLIDGQTTFGKDETERLEFSDAICEEISDMIGRWPQFFQRFLLISNYFIQHGVGFGNFEDSWDWRFDACRLGDVVLPRNRKANEEDLEIAFRKKSFEVHELYARIRSERAAQRGWNVEAVKRVILKAANKTSDGTVSYGNWEAWAEQAKSNDLGASSNASDVDILHCWVKEFSGKVTHLILSKEGDETEFLFEDKEAYESMSQALIAFTYGVGTNGNFHSIRGLGYKIFPHIQVSNRLACQMVDGAMLSSSLLVQPKDAKDLNQLHLTYWGPYAVLAPGLEVKATSTANFSQNAIPVAQDMKERIRSKTGQYTPADALPGGREMSRFEANARLSNASGLTLTNLVLFYEPGDRLLREMVRRITRKSYHEALPGGKFIKELKKKLEARGVPLEALYSFDVDTVAMVRSVGAGSASARDAAFRELTDVSPGFDEVGRKRLLRDRTAMTLGSYRQADRYITKPDIDRVPVDAKIAELENNQISMGMPVSVMGQELHLTHLEIHGDSFRQILEQVENGQAQMFEVVESLLALYEHMADHLNLVVGDPTADQDIAFYKQMLQQGDEIISNGLRQLEKMRREGGGEGAEGPGLDDETNVKLQKELTEHRAKMDMALQKHQLEMQLKISEAETKRAIAEADAASKLAPTSQVYDALRP